MKMEKNKSEELQSRRQFFKKAVKGTLPILGAIALANMPMIANASGNGMASGRCTACQGANCGITCTAICAGNCSGGCLETCMGSCKNGCHKYGK